MDKKTLTFRDLQVAVPTCFWSSLESHKQQRENHGEIIHCGAKKKFYKKKRGGARIKILPCQRNPKENEEKELQLPQSASGYSDLNAILQPQGAFNGQQKKFLPGGPAVGAV